jgi:5-(carboxyamino)imidazole ribonucleotide mutase
LKSIRVGIVMGSASDKPVMQQASDTLAGLGVESQTRVLSAHRTPDALHDWVVDAEKRGVRVFIAGAGAAAHLPGVVASITTRPVIGVPLVAPNAVANGLDALLSIVQMPRGIPVATVALGEAGAANAGILAAQILAVEDEELAGRVRMMREGMAAKVLAG